MLNVIFIALFALIGTVSGNNPATEKKSVPAPNLTGRTPPSQINSQVSNHASNQPSGHTANNLPVPQIRPPQPNAALIGNRSTSQNAAKTTPTELANSQKKTPVNINSNQVTLNVMLSDQETEKVEIVIKHGQVNPGSENHRVKNGTQGPQVSSQLPTSESSANSTSFMTRNTSAPNTTMITTLPTFSSKIRDKFYADLDYWVPFMSVCTLVAILILIVYLISKLVYKISKDELAEINNWLDRWVVVPVRRSKCFRFIFGDQEPSNNISLPPINNISAPIPPEVAAINDSS